MERDSNQNGISDALENLLLLFNTIIPWVFAIVVFLNTANSPDRDLLYAVLAIASGNSAISSISSNPRLKRYEQQILAHGSQIQEIEKNLFSNSTFEKYIDSSGGVSFQNGNGNLQDGLDGGDKNQTES